MGQKWDKFRLLMWKNWVLQYRRPIQTIIEIMAPVLFSIILVIIRSIVDPKPHDAVIYKPFCTVPHPYVQKMLPKSKICQVPSFLNGTLQNFTIIYAPNTKPANTIMKPFSNAIAFETGQDMENYFTLEGRKILAGIQFDDLESNNVKFSLRFPGELRFDDDIFDQKNWRTNLIYPMFQSAGPRSPFNTTGASPNYFDEGFLALQHILSVLISVYKKNNEVPSFENTTEWIRIFHQNKLPFVTMRRFPYAAWEQDVLLTAFKFFLSIMVMLSFAYTCMNIVRSIATEKESQLKEAMKIMGLPNWLHWLAWFLKSFTYLMTSIILMVILLKVKWYTNTEFTVFTHANPLVLLIFLFFYVCATLTFCFAISVFFSKANTAAAMAGLTWFLSYAPYTFLHINYDTLSLTTKLAASLGSNTAMGFGFQLILMYEGTGEGIQFNNIWKPNTPDDSLSLGHIMIMLTIDCIIYLLVALYVEAVFPGEYGIPLKWYFPFTSTSWCGQRRNNGIENHQDNFSKINGEFFEAEPIHLHTGIKIRNLRKTFNSKAAVRNLSLNMYEGQITVLLGHNGAGKTTTMSMLTGMFPPSSGTAIVGGYDIRFDMEEVRNSLGLCPQHNIIFDDLTVAEHLYFFSKLKGMRGQEIDEEITKYLDLLELQSKKDAKSSTLSGGMKRKLCVGISLCGNSKVVMLDEPTAGMDPSARRTLWDLLLKQKTGRTLLLTTHFMDEADLLGDRIAIMAGGELQCCGSSFFLKKKYGAGYHLIMDRSADSDIYQVTSLLRAHIPNIEVHSNIGSELAYLLTESKSYLFETMLRELEKNKEQLGINSYGISLTTLEEVFMKVGADHGQEEIYNGNDGSPASYCPVTTVQLNIVPDTLSTSQSMCNQLKAMTLKKTISTIRSWIILVIQIMLPMIFLIIAMVVSKQQHDMGDLPALSLTLSEFESPVTLIDGTDTSKIYTDYYKNVTDGSCREVFSIEDEILELTAGTPITVRRKYIGGVSLTGLSLPNDIPDIFDVNMTVYFNNDPYHSPAIALGLAMNVMFRKFTGYNDSSIEVTNAPMPYSADTKFNQIDTGNNKGFQVSFNICFSMAFVSSFYILFIVRERVSKSKHLQFVSGVRVYIFWLVTLFWDFITFLVTIIVLLITLVCFQEDGFRTFDDIRRIFFILLYFGWSMLPMMYLSGFFFDVPSTGYTRMTLFSIFTGSIAFLIVQMLNQKVLNLEYVADALHWIFLVIPHYSLATGIRDTFTLWFYNDLCDRFYETCVKLNPFATRQECWNTSPTIKKYCENLDDDYFKWESPGIGRNVLYSFTTGLVLLFVLLLLEYKLFSQLIYKLKQKYFPSTEISDEDSDVYAEKIKIRETPWEELQQNYNLIVKDLTKYYKSFPAVNGINVAIKNHECFGLLGINGAGKTTTFKMLTGDIKISHGDAWVNRKSIKNQLKEVQRLIGYCPQFDALLDDMTARETLHMFSLLRGIPANHCIYIAEKLALDFDYRRHLDKKIKELSGGNKRKLSTSIALIGDPPIVYLDEPTTGMDPGTKRFLWNALCDVRDSGKTIVLTSHSMEECEALCTRLAIMVNGNFKCLGSTQHLKNKFAESYTIIIKVKKPKSSVDSTDHIEKFMSDNFPGSILREKHDELLTYYVTDKSVPWSKMFGILEEAKRRDLNIEDYSLGQSSLEQVFLTITKHQNQS